MVTSTTKNFVQVEANFEFEIATDYQIHNFENFYKNLIYSFQIQRLERILLEILLCFIFYLLNCNYNSFYNSNIEKINDFPSKSTKSKTKPSPSFEASKRKPLNFKWNCKKEKYPKRNRKKLANLCQLDKHNSNV